MRVRLVATSFWDIGFRYSEEYSLEDVGVYEDELAGLDEDQTLDRLYDVASEYGVFEDFIGRAVEPRIELVNDEDPDS